MGRRRHRITLPKRTAPIPSLQQPDIAIAALESASLVVGRDVPPTTHNIVNVLTLSSSLFTPACTHAEHLVRHKVGPFTDKPWLSIRCRVCSGVKDAANGVAEIVCTVRVELATIIALRNQDAGKIAHTRHLDIVSCSYKVRTCNRPIGNQPCAVSVCSTVSYTRTLLLSDRTVLRRTPKTEVLQRVDPSRLTAGILIPGIPSTRVVARLRLTTGSTAFAGFDAVSAHVLVGELGVGVGSFGLPLGPGFGGLVAVQVGGCAWVGTVAGTSGLLSRDSTCEKCSYEAGVQGDPGHIGVAIAGVYKGAGVGKVLYDWLDGNILLSKVNRGARQCDAKNSKVTR